MNILVLTSTYPGEDIPKDITPVVHYFTREWVKYGHNVHVIHSVPYFPFFIYYLLKISNNLLQNRYGGSFLTNRLYDSDYTMDGVHVHRRMIFKPYPHLPYSQKVLNKHVSEIVSVFRSEKFTPDVITIHWDRPGLNLIKELHKYCNAKAIFIAHGTPPPVPENIAAFDNISTIGYRSEPIRLACLKLFKFQDKGNFMCYSGIPKELIPDKVTPIFLRGRVYTYVGTMVRRKHPEALIEVLKDNSLEYSINYIGEGPLLTKLKSLSIRYNIGNKTRFLGHIPRIEVCKRLQATKCFIMISSGEAFGLVYVEAMANGCITIASRGEGMDGIIKDGVNGFLCKAGDYVELSVILDKIEKMSDAELVCISNAARATAFDLTDEKVANNYLNEITKLAE